MESRFHEERTRDAGPKERSTPYADLTFEGGVSTEHEKAGVNIQTNLNLLGSTRHEQALRFSEKGNDAPQVDLSDYLVQTSAGSANLMVGHVNSGNHRHLLNNLASRGVVTRLALQNRFDFSVTSVHGKNIVGWDNPFGLHDLNENNITAGTAGIEIIKDQPGALRFEAMCLTGRLAPEPGFNVGEVVDSEESHGFSLRLQAGLLDKRVRFDFSFARSSFDNPTDPELSLDVDVVEVERTTNNARYLDLSVDLLKDRLVWGQKSASLTLIGSHERVDPLYKSVGAFTFSDLETNLIGVEGLFMDIAFQFQYNWAEDNLDDIATILKTKTREFAWSLIFPLKSMLGDTTLSRPWLPGLTYSYSRVHQSAKDESGVFPLSFVPNQVDNLHNVGAEWSGKRWSFGYLFSLSLQDNRQAEREQADFEYITNSVSMTIQPWDPLSLNLEFSQTDQTDEEFDLKITTKNTSIGGEWLFLPEWVFAGYFSFTDEDDSKNLFDGQSYTVDATLSRQVQLGRLWRNKLVGNSFMRYSLQSDRTEDRTFDIVTDSRVWSVNFGMSISFE
jgi:hypothetical protein